MRDGLAQRAKELLSGMGDLQKREELLALERLIDEESFNLALSSIDESGPVPCPHCGCSASAKRGKDTHGNQRYLCHGCGRLYTNRSRKVFASSKLDKTTWMAFARCHVDRLSLRESALRCHVSLKTAFFMRHRILESIAQCLPSFRMNAGQVTEIDEYYVRETFKGNHKLAGFSIPRAPRTKGEGVKDGSESICVVTCLNDVGDIFFEMVGRGHLKSVNVITALKGRVPRGAVVSTDKAPAYAQVLGMIQEITHVAHATKEHTLNRLNSVHSRLTDFLRPFKGVSVRRLWNYLAWFKWIWSFRESRGISRAADMVIAQAASRPYRRSRSEYKTTPYPFAEYWLKQAKWDALARKGVPMFLATSKVG